MPRNRILVCTLVSATLLLAVAPGCSRIRDRLNRSQRTSSRYTGPDIEQFIKIHSPGAVTLAPDGTLYYIDRPDNVSQIHRIPPGKTQADARIITHFDDGVSSYDMSDDGQYLAITAATGGSEQDNLYLMDTRTEQLEDVFVNEAVVYGSPVWRRDSKAFAYRANDTSPSDFHVYVYDVVSRSPRKVMGGKGYHYPVEFSRDGTRLLAGKYNSASYSQIFEVTLATGETNEVTPAGEEWSFQAVGYDATDRHVVTGTNYHQDLTTLHTIDLRTGEVSPILPQLATYELDGAAFNDDKSVLAVTVNEDGYSVPHLYRTNDMAELTLPDIPKGLLGSGDFEGRYMLYSVNNAKTPGTIYKWDMNKPESEPVAVLETDMQGIDANDFRLPELVKYESFDGRKIPAFLYLPADYREGRTIPFIVYYHGGPEGQYRPSFSTAFQYFISRGYGILAPNVRGSSGYGKEYIEADNYKNRHKSVKDGIWAAKYLVDEGYSKPEMIGAWGGSYGGFMVMATITEAPEMYGAACNVVGIANFQTFLEQTKDYRRHLREAEYGPLSDPEFLKSVSPIYKVDQIQTPLLLAHGLNDPRVPFGEALQIAVALKQANKPVAELYFPDEGHGFRKLENRLLYYRYVADFFDTYLKGEGT